MKIRKIVAKRTNNGESANNGATTDYKAKLGQMRGDKRWQYGAPPAGDASFAWLQQVVRQWAGTGTLAGRVMSGSGAA